MGKISDAMVFLGEFVKNPRQLGSVIPSSGFLKRRIIRAADLQTASVIVELGPGNGGTTRALLASMPADARLLSIELNDGLYQLASAIEDPRYTAHHGDAHELEAILASYGLGAPDVVISGIPFSCFERDSAAALLQKIYQLLDSGGRFVAYQVSGRVNELNTFFPGADSRRVEYEWLNVPPLRVWRWQK